MFYKLIYLSAVSSLSHLVDFELEFYLSRTSSFWVPLEGFRCLDIIPKNNAALHRGTDSLTIC